MVQDGGVATERRSTRPAETPVDTPSVAESGRPPSRAEAGGRAAGLTLVRGGYEGRTAGAAMVSAVSGAALAVADAVTERAPRLPPPAPHPAESVAASASPAPTDLDINQLAERWDEIVAAVRRERPIIGTLLERAIPTAVTANGVVTIQVEDTGAFESLASTSRELTGALTHHVPSLQRVQLLPPESVREGGPRRMTAESIRSETLQALRKKDPVLAAAIDELDLDLLG